MLAADPLDGERQNVVQPAQNTVVILTTSLLRKRSLLVFPISTF